MIKTPKIILLCVLLVLLAAALCLLTGVIPAFGAEETVPPTSAPTKAPTLPPTEPPTEAPTEEPTEPPTEGPTEEPTEPPTEGPTEPHPEEIYTITFVGDCTLGTYKDKWNSAAGFIKTVGEDYDYPFDKVRQYFENDDLTIANLEVVLGDAGSSRDKLFTFRGPAEYSSILSNSSVELVTLANNHAHDYGDAGYKSTKSILDDAKIKYVEEYASTTVTLYDGLVVGIYAVNGTATDVDQARAVKDIKKLKANGADIVIVAAHWGNEGEYRPNNKQTKLGHAMIDAGADIIYGHHPHVLQNMEFYNGGVIYYSLGNFCFGGHTNPKDKDSVIVRQQIVRMTDGSILLGNYDLIPCSISSTDERNTYQPTPYEEGSEQYNRVLDKLLGTFEGSNLDVDYSKLTP